MKDKNDVETVKNYHMALFISLSIGLQGLLMTIINARDGNLPLTFISLAYGLLMLIAFGLILLTKRLIFFYCSIIPIAIYLEINFLLNGGAEGFGILWMTIIPLFTLYIFSKPLFLASNTLVLTIIILGFWTPLNQYVYPFKPSFMTRFPLLYMTCFGFAIFLKYRIVKTEQELDHQKLILAREIQQAAVIQKAFLSQSPVEDEKWEICFDNSPLAGVSGDFYDMYRSSGKLDGIGMYDISGHGISSGLITMLIKNIIQHEFYSRKKAKLQDVMQKINDRFIDEKGNIDNYLTGILVRLTDEEKVEIVNAGHPLPIVYHKKDHKFEIIEKSPIATGAIGLQNYPSVYESQFIEMESGDELIIYTDGITDAKNSQSITYGKYNIIQVLDKYINFPLEEQVSQVFASVTEYAKNTEIDDDMSLVILRKR